MKYLEMPNGEKYLEEDCTPLYEISGEKPVLWAWQDLDGALHDSDDVQEVTMYNIFGAAYDQDESYRAQEYLTQVFWDMFESEQKERLERDWIMMREEFGNWMDSLCKDGEICQNSYNDLDMAE